MQSKISSLVIKFSKHFFFRNNAYGQLGTDSREDSVVPKLIGSFQRPVKTIATGTHHSLAVTGIQRILVYLCLYNLSIAVNKIFFFKSRK